MSEAESEGLGRLKHVAGSLERFWRCLLREGTSGCGRNQDSKEVPHGKSEVWNRAWLLSARIRYLTEWVATAANKPK